MLSGICSSDSEPVCPLGLHQTAAMAMTAMIVIAGLWFQTAARQSPENQGLPWDYEGLSQLSSEDAMIHANECDDPKGSPYMSSFTVE